MENGTGINETTFHEDEDIPMNDVNKSPSKSKSSNGEQLDDSSIVEQQRNSDPSWEEERRHYLKIVNTFRNYGEHYLGKLGGTSLYLKTLPKEHQKLLIDYRKHLHAIRRCVDENQNLCILMILQESHLFQNHDEVYPKKRMKQAPPKPTNCDFDKIQSVFKQIARDWSISGKAERDSCYKPMIDEIESIFCDTKNDKGLSPIRILIPGAGLGRLAHELVCKGYTVEGNEFSLFMIFASSFVLNKCEEVNQYKCFPWVHQTTNVLHRTDQIRPVQFPDINPCDLPSNSKFSMTAGDFLEVYGTPENKESWDCLATCFFIDCANNIIAYLERIYFCLKLGGIWVNMGPLLYHYADLPEEKSIEPSYDILRDIIQKIGFIIEKEETNRPTLYDDNSKSMLSYTYKSVFLVCRKGLPSTNADTLIRNSPCSSTNSSPTKSIRNLLNNDDDDDIKNS